MVNMALKYTTLPEAAREASKNLCAFLLMRLQKKGPSMIVTLKKKKHPGLQGRGARAPTPTPQLGRARPAASPRKFLRLLARFPFPEGAARCYPKRSIRFPSGPLDFQRNRQP